MIKSLDTIVGVHTHTHTHTIHLFKNVFCFYACNFGVAGLVLCAQNLIEDG